MKVYKALLLSLLTYAAPAWQPWAAPSRIEQLERCQNKALKVVTGQLKSTPVETLRREAGICSIATASKRATALAYEKAHRLPLDHPSWQRPPGTALNDQAGDLLLRLQPIICHWSWPTGLPLTPPSPALGKTLATGVYTLTTWHRRAPKMIPPPTCHSSDTSMPDSSARRQRGH